MRKDELYRRQLNLARFKLQEQEETAPAKPLRQKRPLDLSDPDDMFTHNMEQAKLRGESGLISPEAAEKIQRRLLAARKSELETEKPDREDQTSFGQRLTQAVIDTADQVLDTTAMAAYLTPMPFLGVGIDAAHAAVKKFNAEVTYANDPERKKAALDASRDQAFQAAFGAAVGGLMKAAPPIATAKAIARATARVVPKITPEVVKKVVVPVAQATARTARATGKVAARVGKAAIETPLGQAGMRAGGRAATKVQSTRELLNLPLGAVIPQAGAKRVASALKHDVDNFIPDTEIFSNRIAPLFNPRGKNPLVPGIRKPPQLKLGPGELSKQELRSIPGESMVVGRSPVYDYRTGKLTGDVGRNPRPLIDPMNPNLPARSGTRDVGYPTMDPAFQQWDAGKSMEQMRQEFKNTFGQEPPKDGPWFDNFWNSSVKRVKSKVTKNH